MILIDTSVWIDHLRNGSAALTEVLEQERAMTHPFVIGELACGNLKNRRQVLDLMTALPPAAMASDKEVLLFIEDRRLMGKGIGYVDAHLLASVTLTEDAQFWTRDKHLAAVATDLRLAFENS